MIHSRRIFWRRRRITLITTPKVKIKSILIIKVKVNSVQVTVFNLIKFLNALLQFKLKKIIYSILYYTIFSIPHYLTE